MAKDNSPLAKLVEEAADAHTDLCLFGTIQTILEGGNITGNGHASADRIIKICQQQMQVCLVRYDRLVAEIAKQKSK